MLTISLATINTSLSAGTHKQPVAKRLAKQAHQNDIGGCRAPLLGLRRRKNASLKSDGVRRRLARSRPYFVLRATQQKQDAQIVVVLGCSNAELPAFHFACLGQLVSCSTSTRARIPELQHSPFSGLAHGLIFLMTVLYANAFAPLPTRRQEQQRNGSFVG